MHDANEANFSQQKMRRPYFDKRTKHHHRLTSQSTADAEGGKRAITTDLNRLFRGRATPSRGAALRLRRFALDRVALPRGAVTIRSASSVGVHRRTGLVAKPRDGTRTLPACSIGHAIRINRTAFRECDTSADVVDDHAMTVVSRNDADSTSFVYGPSSRMGFDSGRRKRSKISNRRAFSCTALSAHSFFRRAFACEAHQQRALFADRLQALARPVV